MSHNISFSAAILSALLLCSCKSNVSTDSSLQITKDDVIHLEGSFDDNFLDSWDYILLEDDNFDAIIPGTVIKLMYDGGLYFISSNHNYQSTIKVFDSTGHYLNNISRIGRARNEYLYLEEWTLDPYNNQVLLLNSNGYGGPITIKRFDYQGNYLGQMETDSLGDTYNMNQVVKCMSDGSLLIGNGLNLMPVHDYFYIHPDGSLSSPLDMCEYHFQCDGDPQEVIRENVRLAGSWGALYVLPSHFTPQSDTTFLMRMFDNHIYSIDANNSECLANLSCLPDLPENKKYHITWPDIESATIPNYFLDLQDYLLVWYYYGKEYLYEKSTSKLYRMNADSLKITVPDYRVPSVYGNDILAWIDVEEIPRVLKQIDSPNYDHRYSPQVEAFFRKAKDCENPPIIIAHYKKPE